MTRVDFYQIDSEEAPLAFTCRLIEKIYRLGHEVHVHVADETAARNLDDLLWTYRKDRFVPHTLKSSGETAPVVIGHDNEALDHHQVLVNLSGQVPEFFSRYERVAEVVPLDKVSRTAARNNYRFYQERGYPLNYHQMSQ